MASSKEYNEEVLVPSSIITLSQKLKNTVICNLRPSQRSVRNGIEESNFRRMTEYTDGETIDFGFYAFLKTITL
jgi:hypothetical protein